MIKAIKIRLKPTKEQEVLMFKSAGIARFAYNWGLAKQEENYRKGIKSSIKDSRKEFNQLKKTDEYKWLNEVSAQVSQQAFEDLKAAYKKFFDKNGGKPKFKSKKRDQPKFYARYDAIKFTKNNGLFYVQIEKIGKIQYKSNYDIPQLAKYINPRVSFDGKYWYLSLGFEHGTNKSKLDNVSVGIDLGIKDLATVSHIDKPIKNINKTAKVRKIKKKLKRLQRKVSRKYEKNKDGNKYNKTKNISKLEREIKLVHRRLINIRLNHIHQATNLIVKTKPSRVVMEYLNIQGMMKNKHVSKAIQEQKLYEFKRQMKYKCEFNGIDFVEADKWYPSSKMCSCCGIVKKDLKLSDRTYVCDKCGLIEDRDKNASINLANYQVAN
ncbi:putative transposase [Aneurinibacillus soli]|uniref:Putative transposase n=1 Tax=Aneurinibacillus soli TaxID=1500254 RepID=A0A0U4NI38_9BACL|nr:RNA-guided endonuclease TnpB family protein [Aneurinibacillus soli]PYE61738.1 putative transposase [Aneurinibacillus soli]BAU28404.1 putative transposase [Aneurinibacillus soli]